MNELSKDKIISFTQEVALRHNYNRSEVIGMLQEIQENYHYLPESALNELSKCLKVTPQTIYGIATFYAQFSLDPKGKYIVKICDGTACHVKNSRKIYDAVEKKMKFIPGKRTTVDGLFTLETVSCLGACGIAPVMVINDKVYAQMDPEVAAGVIETLAKQETESAEEQ
ncbi:MAG TPA: NAD(P)H-dependent oxidoreductase subunit E [Flexilinea sp.]|jgi:NADH-quinone oxidoreductase subunit E|nr:NAD(P)H-dependent oxidoreductase subunit E [Flexilinea sp.]HPG19999.1 NAD(P)H-dependent oxidoreductase subunit E [Flexilinea sp.]HQJ01564.1 NAD(P)H-dependent oxidoreductase subunit E [Flexilinea sp.]HRY20110.1 NAD(P)H-dependent oxidoreductase subunit E [Flexilinea sp.]